MSTPATIPSPAHRTGGSWPAWLITTTLSTALALFSYRYVARLGPVPPNIAANRFLHPWIEIHAGAAATALLIGAVQFRPQLRSCHPRLHRWIGRTYVAGCASASGAAIVLARGSSSGQSAEIAFIALAIAWICTTSIAAAAQVVQRFAMHGRWMTRSYALTLSAVTLRIYAWLAMLLGWDVNSSFRVIVWLAWVPNALLAELYLRRRSRTAAQTASRAARLSAKSDIQPEQI